MDTIYTTELVALGASLAELAVKGTATAVSTKIKAIRDEKNTDKVRNTYDEIVSELLLERDEAIRIAQSYKSELEKVVISDEESQMPFQREKMKLRRSNLKLKVMNKSKN